MISQRLKNSYKQLRHDESGIAMALAVMMVALLGVMGAGILIFATTDLNTVVESNRGQRAFEMADAGVKIGGKELKPGAITGKFDGGSDDSKWSYCYNIAAGSCTSANHATGITLKDLDGDGSDTDKVAVTIQEISSTSFRVVSTGRYGTATRRVEGIYSVKSTGTSGVLLPPMVGTSGNIQVNGDLKLDNQFMFAGGDIQLSGSSPTLTGSVGFFAGGNFDWVNYGSVSQAPSSNTAVVKDAFKNWKTATKNTANPRPYPDAQTDVPVGIGAIGKIAPKNAGGNDDWTSPCKSVAGKRNSGIPDYSPMRNDASVRYFDKCSDRKFVEQPASSSEITFPFDTHRGADGKLNFGPDNSAQTQAINKLRQVAQANGTYFTPSSGSEFLITNTSDPYRPRNYNWPRDGGSLENTVIFVTFPDTVSSSNANNRVKLQLENTCSAPVKGTIVVENGDFLSESSTDALSGAIITKKGSKGYGGTFTSRGACINGYVWADTNINFSSSNPTFSADLSKIPGFSSSGTSTTTLQNWREVYN